MRRQTYYDIDVKFVSEFNPEKYYGIILILFLTNP